MFEEPTKGILSDLMATDKYKYSCPQNPLEKTEPLYFTAAAVIIFI